MGDVNMAREECCIGRGVAAVQHRTGSASYTYYSMLKLEEYFNLFESDGTVFGSISKKDFEGLEVVLPRINLFKHLRIMQALLIKRLKTIQNK